MLDPLKNMDAKELELPDTTFIRDIETRVFQGMCLQILSQIEGVGLIEGGFFDDLLGREPDRIKGIHVEQDQKKQSVHIRVEITIAYGLSVPDKAEEVQMRLAEEIGRWTGLHVATVHVVFKDLMAKKGAGESALTQEELF